MPTVEIRAGDGRCDWAGPSGSIGTYISEETRKTLEAYRNQPNLVLEHANHEGDMAKGGYAHRQLFELVQNSADALAGSNGGRICIRLTSTHLYCADEGRPPIDEDGVRALMTSHLSPKRGTAEIGRFGLGFKSVLGVTDSPEFFSRSGSFRFDRAFSRDRIRSVAPDVEHCPVLRLAEAVDPCQEREADPILRDFMGWATNIVRLPLKPGSYEALEQQITAFPQEFLLFVEHLSQLTMEIDNKVARAFSLNQQGKITILKDSDSESQWMVVSDEHKLSEEAKSDRRSLDDVDDVKISWAIPVNRLDSTGHFWAFFPTMTTSPLPGILNAPWKTNEDRQNLLAGVYNNELIDFAADLTARTIPELSTKDDPAKHLDALPRRSDSGDNEHFSRLRSESYKHLQEYGLVPNQKGDLIYVEDVLYPPKELTNSVNMDLFESWAAYRHRPSEWLHNKALTRNRLARLDQLYSAYLENHMNQPHSSNQGIPRESVSKWLEALTLHAKSIESEETDWQEIAIEASTAAIRTTVLVDKAVRSRCDMGSIILTLEGKWVRPDPEKVFLNDSDVIHPGIQIVHPYISSDPKTLVALKVLGLKYPSPEMALTALLSEALTNVDYWDYDRWVDFWATARVVDPSTAAQLIGSKWSHHLLHYSRRQRSYVTRKGSYRSWRDLLYVLTLSGEWVPVSKALLPSDIVPGDGSKDDSVTIDLEFHQPDAELLDELGVSDVPDAECELSSERYYYFLRVCREAFTQEVSENPNIAHEPKWDKLNFVSPPRFTTSGPLEVLGDLSEEGQARYTEKLLDIPETYNKWEMKHDTMNIYGIQKFESPTIEVLREHGRIRTERGISKLSEAWTGPSDNPVIRALLSHQYADQILEAFDIDAEVRTFVEAVGEDEAVLLIDAWPGVEPYLSNYRDDLWLVRCDDYVVFGSELNPKQDCLMNNGIVYLIRQNSDWEELQQILKELGIYGAIEKIFHYKTPEEIEHARSQVRECMTDEERLLKAVGETALRKRLPQGLLQILEDDQGSLTGVQIAQAAIATFHTGALREYRHELSHLDPPGQWSGSPKAIEFVRALGFGEDWAGSKNTKRDPFIEVEGPYSLPPLHDFQRKIVDNVKALIKSREGGGEGRGMISMPTGSGKTRVAVQAIVEAIRDDKIQGDILWVADRDELCEQAVEAWRQVWSSEGTSGVRLRISRMWGGQPEPLPTDGTHVIVATVQTVFSKMTSNSEPFEALLNLRLLVFDEAHRSIAPSYTTVMGELGLDRRKRSDEPILIGLTATPYRGHNEPETERLVNRYGRNRLDAGVFKSDNPEEVVQELQDMGVLAKADQSIIEGGKFQLSDEELELSEQAPWLPQSVENRIAGDVQRTRHIIHAYMDRVNSDWPTLIYATSVEHSQVIAALLVTKGVDARAVSAKTDSRTRRRTVEEFRNGDIRVLVNYGIFREGFDAPKTRAVIIARPVYGPNLYFQMIGRGLRGVKNGGNERCLILDVNDNVVNFQKKLAFSELKWLWDWNSSD